MKVHFCLIFILLLVLTGCNRSDPDVKTLIYPNNPWEYKLATQPDWQQGYGAICEGYDSIPSDIIMYRTHFNASNRQARKYMLEINLQGDYLIYLNDKKLAEIKLYPLSFDTVDVKNKSKVERRTWNRIKQTIPVKKSCINDGLNVLTIELVKVDWVLDYPVRISLREKIKSRLSRMKTTYKLPDIYINTFGKEIPDEPKIAGTLEIKTDTGTIKSYVGIEIRGHTSQSYPKKSYGLETRDADGNNNNISLLGLPKENDWVLYAPLADKTLMRNVLAYHIFRKMGHYSVRTRFCNLYINKEYTGIYVLTEKIKRDKNRVNISKFSPDDVTGGYIIANDRNTSADAISSIHYQDSNYQTPYYIIYPDSANLTDLHKQYAKKLIHDFERSVIDRRGDYPDYIDLGSFADYLLLNELSRNYDAYRLSTFYYKNKDSLDPGIYMGPVWDFNLAFGLSKYSGHYLIEGWVYEDNRNIIPFWWNILVKDPVFDTHLKKRWKELRTGILSDEALSYHIDSTAQYLHPLTKQNFKKWPVLKRDTYPNFYNGPTYLDNVEYMKFWLLKRAGWIDENI